jgi:hypothetical protein
MKRRIWIIKWTNPYRQPPDGQPIELRRCTTPYEVSQSPADFHSNIPRGYGEFHDVENDAPRRVWSEEAKQRNRTRRKRKRVMRRRPLLASIELDQEHGHIDHQHHRDRGNDCHSRRRSLSSLMRAPWTTSPVRSARPTSAGAAVPEAKSITCMTAAVCEDEN